MWSEVAFSGTVPTARSKHTAVWSEAANGMYIFGGTSKDYTTEGGAKMESPSTQRRPSCAEASSTTCISSTARPPGAWRLWDFNFLEKGETSSISCHQPCHLAHIFLFPVHFHDLVGIALAKSWEHSLM